ncbi:MAG: CalY family protein [Firmicutes bacterium]|nr:CalY family protein [Bacillota bacterium]
MKKSFLFFIISVILFIPVSVNAASSYNITAQYTNTIKLTAPNEPIFGIQNLNPGDRIERDINITNTGNNPVKMYLAGIEPANENSKFLLQKISFEIYYGNTLLKKGSYDQINNVFLGEISGKETSIYMLVLYFDSSAGNEYQGKTFNVNVTFLGRDPSYVEPEKPIVPETPQAPSENNNNTFAANEAAAGTVTGAANGASSGTSPKNNNGYDTAVAGETDLQNTSSIWGSLTTRAGGGYDCCCNPWPWPPWCECWWHWVIILILLILAILQRRRIHKLRKMLDEADDKIDDCTYGKLELENKINDMTKKNAELEKRINDTGEEKTEKNIKKQAAITKVNTNRKKKI